MWLHVPLSASSLSALALEDSTWPSDLLFPMLAQSVTVKEKLQRSTYWSRTCKRDGWMKRLCGRILPPSTAQRGVEQWIAWWRDSLASPTATLGSAKASQTSDGSGLTLGDSSRKCLLVGRSLRMFRVLYPAVMAQRSLRFKQRWTLSGLMHAGEYSLLPWLERRTYANGSSSWPVGWPTPQAYSFQESHLPGQTGLDRAAKAWSTPTTADGGKRGSATFMGGNPTLNGQAKSWATPTASDWKGPNLSGSGTSSSHSVATQAEQWRPWPTMTARDYKHPNAAHHMETMGKKGAQLVNFVEHCFPHTPTTETDGQKPRRTSGRQLNPRFVEWLMGVPVGWTSCGPWETEWFLFKERMRSALSWLISNNDKEAIAA